MDNNVFTVIIDGVKHEAYVVSNFSVLGDNYCVYAVDFGEELKSIFCDKVVNGTLVKIEDENEKRLTNKIVKALVESVNINGGDNNG